jgi:hypothetical protein
MFTNLPEQAVSGEERGSVFSGELDPKDCVEMMETWRNSIAHVCILTVNLTQQYRLVDSNTSSSGATKLWLPRVCTGLQIS